MEFTITVLVEPVLSRTTNVLVRSASRQSDGEELEQLASEFDVLFSPFFCQCSFENLILKCRVYFPGDKPCS